MYICKGEKKNQNKGHITETLFKVFLIVGIIAGVCFVIKCLCDKYKSKLATIAGDDDFDLDCDDCEFLDGDCCCSCEDDSDIENTDVAYDDEDDFENGES